jgi:hypothetical protein
MILKKIYVSKPNHMGNDVQPAVASSDKIGKNNEILQKIAKILF